MVPVCQFVSVNRDRKAAKPTIVPTDDVDDVDDDDDEDEDDDDDDDEDGADC